MWLIRGITCFSLYALASCTISLPQQSQVKNIKAVPSMEHTIKKPAKRIFFSRKMAKQTMVVVL